MKANEARRPRAINKTESALLGALAAWITDYENGVMPLDE